MTTQDRFIDHGTLPTGIPRVLHQFLLGLYTSMPGEVVSYDAVNRRADVRAALAIVLNDGTQVDRPVISNVPVVFPAGQNFLLTFPLEPGDPVLLVFSMRGLSRWKATHGMTAPDTEGMLSQQDAVAIPGFGPVGAYVPPVEIEAGADSLAMTVKDPADVTDITRHRTIEMDATQIKVTLGDATIGGVPESCVWLQERSITLDRGRDHVALGDGFISFNIDAAGALPAMSVLIDQINGLQISAGTREINIVTTHTNSVTVNGRRLADAGAGTQSANGPGSHSHGLTGA